METGDLEHGRVMEHCINVESNAVATSTELLNEAGPSEILPDSSNVSSQFDIMIIKKTGQRMTGKIDGLPPLLPEPCIFKVHDGLRRVNGSAYTPRLVSIGPYHRGNSHLHAMEEHKLRYLHSLLERINNNHIVTVSIEILLFIVDQKMVERAKACYADPTRMERDKFLEMLLLDACFIIEFLRKLVNEKLRDKDDPIFRSSWMHTQICCDLMLLENQLPFFLLSELLDMTHVPGVTYVPLTILAVIPMCQMLPKEYSVQKHIEKIFNERTSAHEIKHFLDLVHRFYLPSGEHFDSSGQETCTRVSSVTELQEAGISFKVDDSDDVSIFDISFDHSHMKIPKFKVTDSTEIFLRNIVAYEQHSSSVEPKYFTDYRSIMDSLINTEKDVNVLRLRGIMENMLGDDEEVANMFNKLGDGVIINPQTFYYSHVCQEVKKHCKKPWNLAKAKLRRNYFHNPWASISTAAAAVLLLLTLIQTVVALIDLLAWSKQV